MLEIVLHIKFLPFNVNGEGFVRGFEKADLLRQTLCTLEECHTFMSMSADTRFQDKCNKGKEHPDRSAIALTHMMITNTHMDKIIFPTEAGRLVFLKGKNPLPEFIKILVQDLDAEKTSKKKGSMYGLMYNWDDNDLRMIDFDE